AACVRSVLAGAKGQAPRHRARAVDRQGARRGAGRDDVGHERGRQGDDVLLLFTAGMKDKQQVDADARALERLGYVQQLLREMGGFANFALSFSIISILTGAVTLYGDGLRNGGPLVMGLGWPLVTVMTLAVAAAMAELASAYPTAGALYHWA